MRPKYLSGPNPQLNGIWTEEVGSLPVASTCSRVRGTGRVSISACHAKSTSWLGSPRIMGAGSAGTSVVFISLVATLMSISSRIGARGCQKGSQSSCEKVWLTRH